MDRNARIRSVLYDQNSYCTIFVITVNTIIGLSMTGLEVAELLYIWRIEHLRYRDTQFMFFGESMPGVWLGFLYIVTAITGIVARQTKMDPARRHVRFIVFASLCSINVLTSVGMLAWVGYSIDRMRWDYPPLCKGFQYAGTYDHICDYENGFYNLIGLLVPMMILYLIEAITSFFGALFGYQKVCTFKYQNLQASEMYKA